MHPNPMDDRWVTSKDRDKRTHLERRERIIGGNDGVDFGNELPQTCGYLTQTIIIDENGFQMWQ